MCDDEMVIGPYPYPPAACDDYDPRAPAVADRLGSLITRRLPTLTVEHIGSTSIPGCAGKGVIDLMILYPPGQLADAKEALAELGFQPQPNANPHPESRPCRVGSVQYQGSTFRIHAHVIPPGSPEIAQQRAFRERLRNDPGLVATYVAQKRAAITAGFTDAERYNTTKEPFIQQVIHGDEALPAPHIVRRA